MLQYVNRGLYRIALYCTGSIRVEAIAVGLYSECMLWMFFQGRKYIQYVCKYEGVCVYVYVVVFVENGKGLPLWYCLSAYANHSNRACIVF